MERLNILGLIIIALIYVVQGQSTVSLTLLEENTTIFCNPDWYLYEGKCYKLGSNESGIWEVSWHAAADICKGYGGYLMTISSSNLQEFFVSHFLLERKENIWIGLHKPPGQSQFVWHDGSPFVYKNWGWLQPSLTWDGQAEDCTEIMYHATPKGKWNDRACNVERAFVCQMDMDPTLNSHNPEFCSEEIGGGRRFRDTCFHFVDSNKSWKDAEDYCVEQYNGHLATVADAATLQFLEHLYTKGPFYWIGLKMQVQNVAKPEELQKWTSGRYLDLYETKKLKEMVPLEDACGAIFESGHLFPRYCGISLPFLCESYANNPNFSTPNPPIIPGIYCPRSTVPWIDLGGEHCYYFSSDTATWNEANSNCIRKGGTLASFHSEEELEVIETLYSISMPDVHIGLVRDGESDSFSWIDGSEVDFLAWNSDQPSNKMERCTEMTTSTMRWNDINCEIENKYICSIDKIPFTPVSQQPQTTIYLDSQESTYSSTQTRQKQTKSYTDSSTSPITPHQKRTKIYHFDSTGFSTALPHKERKIHKSISSISFTHQNQTNKPNSGQTNVLYIIGIVASTLIVVFILGGVLLYFKPWTRMNHSIPYSTQLSLLEKENR